MYFSQFIITTYFNQNSIKISFLIGEYTKLITLTNRYISIIGMNTSGNIVLLLGSKQHTRYCNNVWFILMSNFCTNYFRTKLLTNGLSNSLDFRVYTFRGLNTVTAGCFGLLSQNTRLLSQHYRLLYHQ